MTARPRAAATVLLALALATTGCLAAVTGTRPVQATATEPSVDGSVLESTGYEHVRTETRTENRTFEVAGQSREANVTSHFAEYQRVIDLGPVGEFPAAVFTVLATPQVNVLGRTRNPVGDMGSVELVGAFQSEYEGVTVGRQVGTANATLLGSETTVAKLEGAAAIGPADVDVYIHVARVRHEGDFVVAFAVYPQSSSDEESAVLTLLRGVEHRDPS